MSEQRPNEKHLFATQAEADADYIQKLRDADPLAKLKRENDGLRYALEYVFSKIPIDEGDARRVAREALKRE